MTIYLPNEQKYIKKLTEIVDDNLTNSSFGVAELAKEMGMSHSTLHRKLKAIARLSISQFIREARLKRAMELLQLQAGTVSEIAYGVGFGSTTYFSKCFHDYYGYSPGQVRKKFDPVLTDQKDGAIKTTIQNKEISIVVLPFANFTGDENKSYIVSGIHDALIGELGQLNHLRVVSKTSALTFLESEKTIKEIASELDIDLVIEGSVLLADKNIKIQIKLLKANPEERLLWSQTFEVEICEILKLYGQVISKIANEIHLKLSYEQMHQFSGVREVNPESYKAYLRGKYHLYQLTPEGMKKGLEYLYEAVKIDPAEPFAYAGLALGYLEIAHGPLNKGDAYIKAEAAAMQALKLDPSVAETLLALAELCIYSTWQFEEGEKYFKQAIGINPNLSIAHYHYSWLLYLLNRNEEAIVEHELAQKCDPFNPMITAFTGVLYAYLGRYDDALNQVSKTFELQTDCPDGYFALTETYLSMGKEEEAIKSSEKLSEVGPVWRWVLGYTYALTNNHSKAEKILEELENAELTSWTAMGIAIISGSLGKMDKAFKWLSYEPHHAWIPWLSTMQIGKSLHQDLRFKEFLKRTNQISR